MNFGNCSKTRTRSIDTEPKGWGKQCEGYFNETEPCGKTECAGRDFDTRTEKLIDNLHMDFMLSLPIL